MVLRTETRRFERKNTKNFASEVLFTNSVPKNMRLQFTSLFGETFQQYLCEMFVKVESEKLSWLRHNQSKLMASGYTHLCELLADAATDTNKVNEWTGNKNRDHDLNVGRFIFLPSTYIGIYRYMRQKMNGIIAISNAIGHPNIFIRMT